MPILDAVRQDIRYALRGLRRSPGFAVAVIATLALGVGANSALFSLADRLFFREPAGVAQSGALRRIYVRSNWSIGGVWEIRDVFGFGAFTAFKERMAPRAHVVAYTPPDSVGLGEGDALTWIRGAFATSDFLPTLGVHAAIGRLFTAQEDRMGNGALVAVISHALWQRRFGGDASVIGRVVALARRKYTVIGVAPARFDGVDLDRADVWMPLATFATQGNGKIPWYASWRSGFQLRVLARVTPETTDAWLSSVGTGPYREGERLNVKFGPDTSATVVAGPLLEALGPSLTPRPDVAITTRLVGVALIVLLVACANVANLLLARGIARRREIAVRLALGVPRARLVVQLLIEGVTLALAAGFVAVLVGVWGGAALQRAVLSGGDAGGAQLDTRLIAATLAIALLTGVFAALVPALRASRPDLTHALKSGARASARDHARMRSTLVVVQAALSVVLLAGAGLFARSLDRARAIDLGFDASRLLFATPHFVNAQGYIDPNGRHLSEIYDGLRDASARIERMPGVEGAALATSSPLGGYAMVGLHLANDVPAPRLDDLDPALFAVTPSYFATTKLELVRGRLIDSNDRPGAEPVVVVNETTARVYWPGRDAIGQCVYFRGTPPVPCSRVVGIVRDTHLDELVEKPHVALFVPVGPQAGRFSESPTYIVVRATPPAIGRVALELRRVLRETFPNAERPAVERVSTRVENQLRPWKLGASIFAAFGALSLLVAAMGAYSVVAYAVSLRTHEIGVRMALGARHEQIIRLVFSQGMRMTLVGLAVGVALALLLARFVASMLYGTSAHDPVALSLAAATLAAAALAACTVPAWQAARTDPALALRAE